MAPAGEDGAMESRRWAYDAVSVSADLRFESIVFVLSEPRVGIDYVE